MAIKEAIAELNNTVLSQQDLSIEIHVERADEIPTHEDKVSQIRTLIRESNIIIVDISGFNPNVLWELGYSTALQKHIIVICEEWDNLPFNIRVIDICKYRFGYEDILDLKNKVMGRLRSIIPLALREEQSLIRHPEFEAASRQVMSALKKIKDDSLLKRLALSELTRTAARFEELGKGLFELRNEKPYKEVLKHYVEYISQLKGDGSKFDVVSNLNFWKEITNNGKDFSYIHANIKAARGGAHVRRVILVDATVFPSETLKADATYSAVLEEFYRGKMGVGNNIQTRLLFSKYFAGDRESYSNFGVLTKGAETLIFNPQYDDSLRMTKTTFIYFNKESRQLGCTDARMNIVESYKDKFLEAWDKSKDLDEKHFN